MEHVQVFALVIAAVAVTAVCRNRGWPAPLVLVGVAIAVSLVPSVPRYEIEPRLLLEFVLPPLLYSAALSSSYRDFRGSWNSITRLGVGLVLLTAFVAALAYWWFDETAIPLLAALALGAVVAPPDAVAAAAVGRRLGLPRRVMTLLSGESLINDATSLTLYKVALAGVATGAWALGEGLAIFGLAVVVGVGVGLVIGLVVHYVRIRLDDPVVASAIGLLTPFAAYWGAEQIMGSGVLAVVTAGSLPRAHVAPRRVRHPALRGAHLVDRRPAAGVVHVRADRHAAAVARPGRHRLRPGPAARARAVGRGARDRDPRATGLHLRDRALRQPASARQPPTGDGLPVGARVRGRVLGGHARGRDARRCGSHPRDPLERRPVPRARDPAARRLLGGHRHVAPPGPDAALGHPPAQGGQCRRDRERRRAGGLAAAGDRRRGRAGARAAASRLEQAPRVPSVRASSSTGWRRAGGAGRPPPR